MKMGPWAVIDAMKNKKNEDKPVTTKSGPWAVIDKYQINKK